MRIIHFIWIWAGCMVCSGELAWAISNGDFSSGLASWTARGNVTTPTLSGGSNNKFCLLAESESGGLSQILQDFTLPNLPESVTFRFRFLYASSGAADVPPDSFCVYFVDPAGGDRLVGVPEDAPAFTPAFLYMDTNGVRHYDADYLTIEETADEAGLSGVTLTVPPTLSGTARIVFSLNTADNGVVSSVLIDGVAVHNPEDPNCNPDVTPPEITFCPPNTESASYDPADTGYATATDNCPPIDPPGYLDIIRCGCPTVAFRTWLAEDNTGNTATCDQRITGVETDTDFYICLAGWFDDCFLASLICDCQNAPAACDSGDPPGLPLNVHVNGGCTVAEMLTECFKKQIRNGGDIQSCAVHLYDILRKAQPPLVCGNRQGQFSSCVADQHEALLAAIQGGSYNLCRGGPPGTELCTVNTDCDTYANGSCCTDPAGGKYCVYGTQPCPLPPPPEYPSCVLEPNE